MSNLNMTQFGQLPMFMQTSEIIDNVHKVDSQSYNKSPRSQWDDIRYDKLADSNRYNYSDMPTSTTPPLHIEHVGAGRGYFEQNDEPQQELWDGHHRLALAEDRGTQWLPVIHHDSDNLDTHERHLKRYWGINGAGR